MVGLFFSNKLGRLIGWVASNISFKKNKILNQHGRQQKSFWKNARGIAGSLFPSKQFCVRETRLPAAELQEVFSNSLQYLAQYLLCTSITKMNDVHTSEVLDSLGGFVDQRRRSKEAVAIQLRIETWFLWTGCSGSGWVGWRLFRNDPEGRREVRSSKMRWISSGAGNKELAKYSDGQATLEPDSQSGQDPSQNS